MNLETKIRSKRPSDFAPSLSEDDIGCVIVPDYAEWSSNFSAVFAACQQAARVNPSLAYLPHVCRPLLAAHQALHAVTGRIYDVSLAGDTTPARTWQGLFVAVADDDVMLQWTDAAVFESLRAAIGFVAMHIDELERCLAMPETYGVASRTGSERAEQQAWVATQYRPRAVREVCSLIGFGAVFAPGNFGNLNQRPFPRLADA